MKISYSWLKTYLHTDLDLQKIAEVMIDIGLEAEGIEGGETIEIGLTPNRADAMSHYGVARDLYAALKIRGYQAQLIPPPIDACRKDIKRPPSFEIIIENPEKCLRYAGLTFSQVQVTASPPWLKNRLKAIEVNPINNVVDITNFVMHELGQPLHAFDADQIKGRKIWIKTLPTDTPFETLDHIHRKLHAEDLMICNIKGPLCMAGILGGAHSGITTNTKNIFLESAYFHPITIRQSAKRHGLNTEASFRFERGIDPNQTLYALQRAAILIQKLTGGQCSSNIIDLYPNPISPFEITLRYEKMNRLLGEEIPPKTVKEILSLLEINILSNSKGSLKLSVPPYRVDVQREADVIEEALRIYGYNRIQIPEQMSLSISPSSTVSLEKIEEKIARQLIAHGFYETINLSLYKPNHLSPNQEMEMVSILNPLSQDLSILRPSLLYSMLECITYNINRKNTELQLFEWGKTYQKKKQGFLEENRLALVVTNKKNNETHLRKPLSFFYLKGITEQLLQTADITAPVQIRSKHSLFEESLSIQYQGRNLIKLGQVKTDLTKKFNINQKVFFADIDWEAFLQACQQSKVQFKPLPRYPGSRRDLALLLDHDVSFEEIHQLAKNIEKVLLKKIQLFDVYKGSRLPKGKKSYALSFYLEDENQTLTDEIIDQTMVKLQQAFKEQLGAKLR
ncbi:MAG: phenylalanine--tRNA ligase subunit beta [Flavobacteriales bacterium AspAUS03]